MSESTIPPEFQQMSVAERILLVERIWDSIAADQHPLQPTQAEKEELDRRLDAHCDSTAEDTTWPEVKNRLTTER